jgi:hypothetical protein
MHIRIGYVWQGNHQIYVIYSVLIQFWPTLKMTLPLSQVSHSIGLVSQVAQSIGLVSQVAHTIGLVSQVAHAIGLVSQVAHTIGLVSQVAHTIGLVSQDCPTVHIKTWPHSQADRVRFATTMKNTGVCILCTHTHRLSHTETLTHTLSNTHRHTNTFLADPTDGGHACTNSFP